MRRFLISFFIAVACFGGAPWVHAEDAISSLRQSGKAFASVAKKVSPAVVNIQVEEMLQAKSWSDSLMPYGQREDMPDLFNDFFRHFFHEGPQQGPSRKVLGQGSGFIISQDGYIVTNSHVVQKASKIIIKMQDGREFDGKVIGSDPQSDLAVLKIEGSNLPTLAFGNSTALQVGEWVVAVGNPFGLSHSLSAGIVSAKGRSSVGIAQYENFIQTDAAINPGNSGGPLVDLEGNVVGINTAIFSRSGGYMGIGFAIPIDMAKSIVQQLQDNGVVTRGYLGVRIQNLTQDLARGFGLKGTKGVLIAQVEPGTPAAKAGLKQGDVITQLDGKAVTDVGDFRNRIAAKRPGGMHKLKVLRDNSFKTVKFKVESLPGAETATETPTAVHENISKLGVSTQNLNEEMMAKLGFTPSHGVVITKIEPGSLADYVGLSRGQVILEINRHIVKDVASFNKYLKQAKQNVLLLVQSRAGVQYVAVHLD